MRMNGINIPEDLHFEWCNDNEEKEMAKWNNEQNISITAALVNLHNSGYPVDVLDVEEKTGFKIDKEKMAKMEDIKQKSIDFPGKSQLNNYYENALHTTKDDEYGILKEKREKYTEKLDKEKALRTPEGEQYKEYMVEKRIDKEYVYLTEGTGGNEEGMTKEEYQQYQDELSNRIEDRDLPDGDVMKHINCRCYTETGEDGVSIWVVDPDCCDDCNDDMEQYNNATPENKIEIFNKHKDLILKKKGIMSKK
jgi:hypothetical protein